MENKRIRKGLGTLAAALMWLYTFSDVQTMWHIVSDFIVMHPFRAACLVASFGVLAITYWEDILALFGIRRPKRLMHIIKDHLLLEHGYSIKKAEADSTCFRIIAEREGSKFTIEKHPTKDLLQIKVCRLAEPSVTEPEMKSISDYQRAELKDEIMIALEQMNSLHHVATAFNDAPFTAEAGLQIPTTSFTEAALMDAVFTVERAGMIIGLVWSKWFRKIYLARQLQD